MQLGHITVRRGVAALVTVITCCSLTSVGAAQELRPVLSSGDEIPGLGQIGRWGLHLMLLDDAGRALVSRVDGEREESYWADGDHFTPLLNPAGDGDLELIGDTLVGHPTGAVAGFGFRPSQGAPSYGTLVVVTDGRATPIVRVGDDDPDGYRFCALRDPAVNDRGAVVFSAVAIAPGGLCPGNDPAGDGKMVYTGLYLADGDLLQRLGGTGPLAPAGWDEPAFDLPSAQVDGHGGCAIEPPTREPGWLALLGMVVLVAMRRRRCASLRG